MSKGRKSKAEMVKVNPSQVDKETGNLVVAKSITQTIQNNLSEIPLDKLDVSSLSLQECRIVMARPDLTPALVAVLVGRMNTLLSPEQKEIASALVLTEADKMRLEINGLKSKVHIHMAPLMKDYLDRIIFWKGKLAFTADGKPKSSFSVLSHSWDKELSRSKYARIQYSVTVTEYTKESELTPLEKARQAAIEAMEKENAEFEASLA